MFQKFFIPGTKLAELQISFLSWKKSSGKLKFQLSDWQRPPMLFIGVILSSPVSAFNGHEDSALLWL